VLFRSGTIGTGVAARANPDGYTIVFGTTSTMAVNQVIMKQVPYDFSRDFALIGLIANAPHLLAVRDGRDPLRSGERLITHVVDCMTVAAIGARLARIPALGERLHIYQLARLYRTVGMLQRGGTPMVTAMRMSAGLLGANLRLAFADATQAVREGRSIADAMEQYGLTTPVAARMLRVGERSGNMGEMMERIAAFYDEELSRWVAITTRLVEPALMSLIGILIGGIVVLMYFPIFELAGSIR